MAYAAFDNDYIYQPRLPDLRDPTRLDAPTPGRNWTPSVICSSPDREPLIFSERSSPLLLDIAVKEYAIWHQSRVSSETFRENIQKARDVALENCLDLKQIHDDQDADFFVKNGVKAGAARRFVSDIARWVTLNRDPNGIEDQS
ncbi:hypothetical protein N7493_010859 [Penicillium malachiteum]|uniref:Uncharacterized protein n=1 Tax=Penicillium malachiteum TaxID=1324776 RepID=A0AAD6HB17_9EURO|nr:hypothetical protein N7493_010859 [Penicillium malachiteum]